MTKNDALNQFASIFVNVDQVNNLVDKLKKCFESAKSDSLTNNDPDGLGYAHLTIEGVDNEFSCEYQGKFTGSGYKEHTGNFYSAYNHDKNGDVWVVNIDEYDSGIVICGVYNKTEYEARY